MFFSKIRLVWSYPVIVTFIENNYFIVEGDVSEITVANVITANNITIQIGYNEMFFSCKKSVYDLINGILIKTPNTILIPIIIIL